jgi:hypothetical protein
VLQNIHFRSFNGIVGLVYRPVSTANGKQPDCDFYSDLRYALTENACILLENFENLILEDKFLFIMSNEEIQPFFSKKFI